MKTLSNTGFAVSSEIVRPVLFYTLDKWTRRLMIFGNFFSSEIQYQYAMGLLETMIEDELKQVLKGVVVPGRVEAVKRKIRNAATFTGQKQEWHVFGKIRELKRQILKAVCKDEDLYHFYSPRHRDIFWQSFANANQFRRLIGLLVVSRHIQFTQAERIRFSANLSKRIDFLYS